MLPALTRAPRGFEAVLAGDKFVSPLAFSNWRNRLAVFRIYEMAALLGRLPDMHTNQLPIAIVSRGQGRISDEVYGPGNMAVWTTPVQTHPGENTYHRWEINDEAFLHTKPAPHADFFFAYVQHPMHPAEKTGELWRISGSITRYPLGRVTGAGCHFRGAAVATLSLVRQYALGELSLEQAADEYDRRIAALSAENEAFDREFLAIMGEEGRVPNERHRDRLLRTTPLTNAYERFATGHTQ